MSIVKVDGLTKRYGSFTAVDNISFEVGKGELIGFLGVNGAGKSTTINMMSTLLEPSAGSIDICGYDTKKEPSEIRRRIGIVYQNNVLDDLLSVKENLICRGVLHGSDKRTAVKRLNELSEIFSIDDILGKKYRMLSGGQKRRAEIAAALMHTPELLILDEPTTGLDPAARKEVWSTVEQLRKNADMTVFLTTHYMEEAAEADQIIIINKGRIIADGKPHELKEKYAGDNMSIYCSEDAARVLKERLGGYEIIDENNGIRIMLGSTLEAADIMDKVKDIAEGFEVVQGTMDDVFINATKEI